MHIPVTINQTHKYIAQVIRDGKVIASTGLSDNLIVDAGWDFWLGSSANCFLGPCVGTGSAVPDVTDTALDNFLFGTSYNGGGITYESPIYTVSGDNAGTVPRVSYASQAFTWPMGAVVGNLTEVGLYISTTNAVPPAPPGVLFSRALFEDTMGNPVTITVTAADFLRITLYRERHTAQTDVVGTVSYDLDGVISSRDYTARPVVRNPPSNRSGNYWQRAFGSGFNINTPITIISSANSLASPNSTIFYGAATPTMPSVWTVADSISGLTGTGLTSQAAVRSGDSMNVTYTYGPVAFNSTEVKAAALYCGYAQWCVIFSPAVQKLNTQSMVISLTVTFGRNVP